MIRVSQSLSPLDKANGSVFFGYFEVDYCFGMSNSGIITLIFYF